MTQPCNFSARSPDRRFAPPGDDATLRFASLRTLGAVFRAALLTVLDALGVQHTAQNVVADAGQILDAAAADHDHRMLLQVMALAGDIADHLEAVGQPHLGDLAQRRIRLLRRGRVDARAYAALLRARLEMAGFLAVGLRLPRLADQLTNRRHVGPKFASKTSGVSRTENPSLRRSTFARSRQGNVRNHSAPKTRTGFGRRQKQRITGSRTAIVRNRTGPSGQAWLVFGRIVSVYSRCVV